MDRGHKIALLMEELRNMPEFELVKKLQGFGVSIYTFDKNYLELNQLLIFLADDPRADSLFWLSNRDRLNQVMYDVIRLVHNFVSASLSLIDHTRRIYNTLYESTGKFPDYRNKINSEFAFDPLSQFVKCLRHYCQHYKSPNIQVTTQVDFGADKATRTFSLLREDLESFDGWTLHAKKFLGAMQKDIDISKLATEYRNKVMKFYEWFQAQQAEIHQEEIYRFKEKENTLLALSLEDRIDMSFWNSERGVIHSKDEIFISVFTSEEYIELEKIPRDSAQRPRRAIDLLEQRYFPISDDVKRKILQLYKLPDIFPRLPE